MSGGMAVFLITAVVVPLLLTEFGDWCPWLAARIVRWAARHLGDPASCERYEEEWTANLNEVPGKLARLIAALGYLAYMPSMRRSVRRRATPPHSSALIDSGASGRILITETNWERGTTGARTRTLFVLVVKPSQVHSVILDALHRRSGLPVRPAPSESPSEFPLTGIFAPGTPGSDAVRKVRQPDRLGHRRGESAEDFLTDMRKNGHSPNMDVPVLSSSLSYKYYSLPQGQCALLGEFSPLAGAPSGKPGEALLLCLTRDYADHLIQELKGTDFPANAAEEANPHNLHVLAPHLWELLQHHQPPECVQFLRRKLLPPCAP